MLLKSFVFLLQVKVSVHQCLVGIVYSFQVGILGSFVNFKAVKLSLVTLKVGSVLVSLVVLVTVLLKFSLLIVNEVCINLFEFIDFKIKPVDHAFEFANVSLSSVNFHSAVFSVFSSLLKLFVKTVGSLNKSLSLFVKHSNSCVLCKTFLLPFRQSAIVLVNR